MACAAFVTAIVEIGSPLVPLATLGTFDAASTFGGTTMYQIHMATAIICKNCRKLTPKGFGCLCALHMQSIQNAAHTLLTVICECMYCEVQMLLH